MIGADHGQFYVQDLEPYDAWIAGHKTDPDLPPAGWTQEAVYVHRIGVEPHSISVGTARNDMVESLITVHTSAPTTDLTAEHIVETHLDAPTGQLTMSSPGTDPADGPSGVVDGHVTPHWTRFERHDIPPLRRSVSPWRRRSWAATRAVVEISRLPRKLLLPYGPHLGGPGR
ncbi:hypothetical protein [Streptomyces cinerochromogenes]|uniref:hypothetical protein n=1 Tax=Streptomyces cinerochromogenes TaxID=66422 RepID=UPI0016714DF6|nr:hypothetical protein [Streptomyces cinerochromogenes]GGS90043.1 hypothetical protein GCM10010206_60990 [Streptomyces cinerochromogenes]